MKKNLAVLFLVIACPVAALATTEINPTVNATVVGANQNDTNNVMATTNNFRDPNEAVSIKDSNLQKSVQLTLGNMTRFSQSLNGVKITAIDGRVTLEGVVASEDEKIAFGNQVEKVIGVNSVDNQLQVSQ